ncbi:MAG: flagellar biosynthesis protein [Clostridiaceae bacterium]|nr:flagellar biosynthesis protein [Clostridiaceae bacterium]
MNINSRPVTSIHQIAARKNASVKTPVKDSSEFAAILNQKLSESRDVKLSKHAAMRLESRNISLSGEQYEKLKDAVDMAQSKGIKDTLVLMDNVAFVVNVNARTVITAVGQGDLKDNVFTNIDGAVIAR